jgi:hypothetical protein
MPASPRSSRALALAASCLAAAAVAPQLAGAVPITVNVRVEGSTATLFEGPVSAEALLAPGISTKSSGGAHPCDVKDNGENGGFVAAAATPTAALYAAASGSGIVFDASWSTKPLNDFFVSQVGSDVNGGAPEFPSWGYAVNYTTAGVGGCQFQLAPGSEVLWAYNYFNLVHLLSVSGPTSANVVTPVAVRVVDAQTGQPISGASIGQVVHGTTTPIAGFPLTDASGYAAVSFAQTGNVTLKATRADSVRSNAITICVHAGSDGTCGTGAPSGAPPATQLPSGSSGGVPMVLADTANVVGVRNGHVYARRGAPRLLGGVVRVPAGGTLSDVRIRVERRDRGRCFNFSGRRAVFVRARGCHAPQFFSVGATVSFSYLLPARLPRGRYVYDIEAVDNAGHATNLVAGVSHVVFRVQ